jgi:hypothetical protein
VSNVQGPLRHLQLVPDEGQIYLMAALFTSFDHGFSEYFLTRDNVEYDDKVVPLILCAKQKVLV